MISAGVESNRQVTYVTSWELFTKDTTPVFQPQPSIVILMGNNFYMDWALWGL